MIDAPEVIQEAASFDWETFLPVIFFILYGIAQFLGSRKSKKGEGPAAEENAEADPMERAKQIREEIQRKIQERTKAKKTRSQPASRESQYDPTLPENQQPKPTWTQQSSQRQPAPAPPKRPVVQEARSFSMDSGTTDIEKRLHEQRKRLEVAKKRQQEARAEASRIMKRAWDKGGTSSKPRPVAIGTPLPDTGSFRSQVIAGLGDTNSLRKAVLYREILDPPVGLR